MMIRLLFLAVLLVIGFFIFGLSRRLSDEKNGNSDPRDTVGSKMEAAVDYEPSTKSYELTDPFPWSDRDSLVIYAGDLETSNKQLDNSIPSIIIHNFESIEQGFSSDGVPYITEVSFPYMRHEINRWLETQKNSCEAGYNVVLQVREWIENKIDEGCTYFYYSIEPKEYAGNAYPWARYEDRQFQMSRENSGSE